MLPSATDAANQPSLATPTQQVKVNGMKVVWDLLRAKGVLEKALTVILKSWRRSTQKQHQVYEVVLFLPLKGFRSLLSSSRKGSGFFS